MRLVALALLGLAGLALSTTTAGAIPAAAAQEQFAAKSLYQEVAQGCGRGYHWLGKHRNRYGRWVPGHCAPN